MADSLHRTTLLAACLVGFWLSLLACWVAAPLVFYPYTALDPSSCAGLPASELFGLATARLPILVVMSVVYVLPILFLIGLSRFSERNESRTYPNAVLVLFAVSLGFSWVETLGDALACGLSAWGLVRTILMLGSVVVTLMLFVEAVGMARHYVVEPD